jgi:pantoate--beta-alanine ligase
MKVIREISAIQDISDYYKCTGKKVALVPTMGYLHQGHASLILKAKEQNEIVVVSIFVNPAQFGKNEDYDKYPRDFQRDYHICEKAGVDYIFNPDVSEMYKTDNRTTVRVSYITDKLEGKLRPGHFDGVATVVIKLLNAVKPHNLYLGQKDAQQNVVIKKIIEDLNIDVNVVICDTFREENGLAMSSRNTYLSGSEKDKAKVLYQLLTKGKELILQDNVIDSNDIKKYICTMLKNQEPDLELQYFEITDSEKLDPLENIGKYKGEILISAALKIRDIRLIDNVLFRKN